MATPRNLDARLHAFVEEARARAKEPAPVTNAGGDVDATISVARGRLQRYDVAGARELLAERAKSAGVEAVVFDRGGNKYHGRVAAIADGAREGGLSL